MIRNNFEVLSANSMKKKSYKEIYNFKIFFRIIKRIPFISILFISPIIIFGIFSPLLYTHDPHTVDLYNSLRPPAWMNGGEWTYLLGTDQLGRDLYSRIVEGARTSLIVAVPSVIFSGFVGISIGLIAGYFGGRLENIIMRITEIWMAIPQMFFLLLLVAVMRNIDIEGVWVIVISITITMWMPYVQMIRGEVISIKKREFIIQAKITGCSTFRILIKHLLPNVKNTIVVLITGMFGGAIMAEAGATFLGIGIQPPNTAWGMLISESSAYMDSAWWIPTFAGLSITITVIGFNLLGDWIRDIME